MGDIVPKKKARAMAEAKFSHITVSSDEDDDIVIQAGAAPAARPEARAAAGNAAADAASARLDERPASGARAAGAPKPVSGGAPSPSASQRVDAAPSAASRAKAPAGKAEGAYRGTTLEDIESSKMSTPQKAIIALAVLGIAAFVCWYFLVR